ncbi:MAG: hypothetical protein RLZZ58_1464 [Pseudomonadota bacterium]
MWSRLGWIWLRAIVPGAALALLLVAVQVGIIVAVGRASAGFDKALASAFAISAAVLPLLAHALFVTLLADHLICGARWPRRPRWVAVRAGLILAIPIILIGWLDAAGASYGCADGQVFAKSPVPMWPWAWIGWLALAMTALPTCLLRPPAAEREPWYNRAMLLAPFAVIVLITGLPFQRRSIDCTPPFDGGWGLFEGGIIMFPLLALFLFSMAFSLAVLSATFVIPRAPQGT